MDRLLRSKNKCLIEQLHHQQACMHMSLEKLRGVEDEGQNTKLYTIRAKPTDHTENMAQDQMLQNVNDGDFIQQQYSSTPISCGTRQAQAPYNCTIHINQLPEANCVVQSGDHEEGIQLKQTRSCIVNSPVKVQYVKPTVDRSIQTDQAKLQTVETCTTTDLPVTPDVKNNAANGDPLRINVLKKRYDALRKYYQDGIEDQPCLQRPSHTHTPPRVSCGELHDYFYTNYPSRYFRDLSNVSPTLQRTNGKSWFEARGRTPMYKSGGMRYPSSSSRPSPYDAAKQQHLSQNLRGLDLSHLRQKKGSDNKAYGERHQDCMGHAMKDRRDKVQPFQLYAPWLDLRKDKGEQTDQVEMVKLPTRFIANEDECAKTYKCGTSKLPSHLLKGKGEQTDQHDISMLSSYLRQEFKEGKHLDTFKTSRDSRVDKGDQTVALDPLQLRSDDVQEGHVPSASTSEVIVLHPPLILEECTIMQKEPTVREKKSQSYSGQGMGEDVQIEQSNIFQLYGGQNRRDIHDEQPELNRSSVKLLNSKVVQQNDYGNVLHQLSSRLQNVMGIHNEQCSIDQPGLDLFTINEDYGQIENSNVHDGSIALMTHAGLLRLYISHGVGESEEAGQQVNTQSQSEQNDGVSIESAKLNASQFLLSPEKDESSLDKQEKSFIESANNAGIEGRGKLQNYQSFMTQTFTNQSIDTTSDHNSRTFKTSAEHVDYSIERNEKKSIVLQAFSDSEQDDDIDGKDVEHILFQTHTQLGKPNKEHNVTVSGRSNSDQVEGDVNKTEQRRLFQTSSENENSFVSANKQPIALQTCSSTEIEGGNVRANENGVLSQTCVKEVQNNVEHGEENRLSQAFSAPAYDKIDQNYTCIFLPPAIVTSQGITDGLLTLPSIMVHSDPGMIRQIKSEQCALFQLYAGQGRNEDVPEVCSVVEFHADLENGSCTQNMGTREIEITRENIREEPCFLVLSQDSLENNKDAQESQEVIILPQDSRGNAKEMEREIMQSGSKDNSNLSSAQPVILQPDSELWTDDSSQRDLLQGGVESSDDGNVRRAVKPVTTNSPIDGGSGRKAIGKVIFLGSTAVDRKTEPPKPPPSASSVDEDDSKFLDYLETLEQFRRQYPNECMSPMRPSWLGFNVNDRSADSQEQGYVGHNTGTDIPDHQCVFDYKLNGRLFPEAVHTDRENRSICPTCKSPERVPTSTNPTYTRISVSRSALAPPYRLQHRTKQAFMLKGSLALSQHCLAGHQYTGEITRPETSTVDLRTEMNKDKLATQVLPPDGTRTTTQELLTRSHKIRQSFNRILMDSRHRPADMKHQRPLPLF